MDIKYHKTVHTKENAIKFWTDIATEYNSGIPAKELAIKNGCTRSHIYWILKRVSKL